MTVKGLKGTAGARRAPRGGGEPRPERARKPADPAYLERAALYYLERFATTRGHLAQVLRHKVRRRGLAGGISESEAEQWIAALVEKLVRLGYVDDMGFAQARARSLHARGKPMRANRRGLAEKSVPAEMIDQVLESMADSPADTDLLAAIRYVKRRRLGPARPDRPEDAEAARKAFQRDMAALARSGFSYDIARRVLEADGPHALDELEREAEGE
jgi:regulatory protein